MTGGRKTGRSPPAAGSGVVFLDSVILFPRAHRMAAPAPSTPTANVEIVPDDDPHAGEDPAFLADTDKASSTLSLSSSVLNYQ